MVKKMKQKLQSLKLPNTKNHPKNLPKTFGNRSFLQNVLYLIPNIPYEKVVAGVSADDNEVVYQSHEVHGLGEGAIPHWELAKNII
jgi:seryl-tRNA synthetase